MTGNIIARTDLTNALFRELGKNKRISAAEEKELLHIYKDETKSDEERENAKNRILMGNIRWIITMAKKYSNADDFNDIFSEAYIGAEKALEMYDASKKVIFMTFARHYIQREINAYLNRVKPAVIITNYPLQPRIKKERSLFVQEHMREPSAEELAAILKDKYDVNVKNVEDLYQVTVIPTTDTRSDDDEYTFEETEEFTEKTASHNSYDDTVDNEHNQAAIGEFLSLLSEKERKVVCMSYGIGTNTPMSNEEIAETMGYTTERIRQIIAGAMKKMQATVGR